MRFTSIVTLALSMAGLVAALPVERRAISSLNGVDYTSRNSDGSCQSPSEIIQSVKLMKSSGVHSIRTYAQECESLPSILKGIKQAGGGMTVLAGVWIDGTSNDDAEISRLKSTLSSSDVSPIIGITVGNEVLFKGLMSSSQLVSKVKAVKAISNGIPVGSVEVDSTYSSDLMAASDFAGVNIHPFYANVDIKKAYSNLQTRYNNFKKSAKGKQVYITETGWPSSGGSQGAAVASLANSQTFVNEVSQSSLPYYVFEWQDAEWKSSDAEGHFGLLNNQGKSKYAI